MVKKAKKKTKKKTTAKKEAGKTSRRPGKKPAQDPAQEKEQVRAAAAAPAKGPEVVPYPTAGRKITEFEDRLDQHLAAADVVKKRGRGRPPKEAEQPPPEIDVKVIGQAIQIPFDLWAVGQDIPDLKISVQESTMIAKPLKVLLDHYMPNVPEITWAWISLGAVSYSIMKCRLVLIAEIKKERTSSEQVTGVKDRPERRAHGSAQSSVFPTVDQILNPEN